MYIVVPTEAEREALLQQAKAAPLTAWRRHAPGIDIRIREAVQPAILEASSQLVVDVLADSQCRVRPHDSKLTWDQVYARAVIGAGDALLDLARLASAEAREAVQRDQELAMLHDEQPLDGDDEWSDLHELEGSLVWLAAMPGRRAEARYAMLRLLGVLQDVPIPLRDQRWHECSHRAALAVPTAVTVDDGVLDIGYRPPAPPVPPTQEEEGIVGPDVILHALLESPAKPPSLSELPPIPLPPAPPRTGTFAPWALAPYSALAPEGRKACGMLTDKLLLRPWPRVDVLREQLLGEFPWLHEAVDTIVQDLDLQEALTGESYQFRPLVLVGAPGCGKSRLITRLVDMHGGSVINGAGMSDNRTIAGSARGWSTATPTAASLAAAATRQANPLVAVDELDKVGGSGLNGDATQTLLSMLEPTTAKAFLDEGLGVACDMSRVCWIFSANDRMKVPALLRTRLRFVSCPAPRPQDFSALLRGCLNDIAADIGVAPERLPWLEDEVIAAIETGFRRGHLSARSLARVVRSAITAAGHAERQMPRH